MIKKDVTQTNSGVKINFSGVVQKQNIVKMVQNCQTGQCECMSDETKSKIKDMSVTGEDGSVELSLDGDISSDEIQEALNRSKLL
jgi:hypothetical protein